MVVAGVIYVLVSMAAALTVDDRHAGRSPTRRCSRSSSRASCPSPTDFMTTLFAVIAMIAITNTTLVTVVTQPRILYGMAREDVVPGVFAKIHPHPPQPVGRPALQCVVVVGALLVVGTLVTEAGGGIDLVARLATVTVVFLLVHLRARDRLLRSSCAGRTRTSAPSAPTRRCWSSGWSATSRSSATSIYDDPTSLLWCAGLLAVGGSSCSWSSTSSAVVAPAATGHRDLDEPGEPDHARHRRHGRVQAVAGRRQAAQVVRRSRPRSPTISVVAVIRPLASVAFADDLVRPPGRRRVGRDLVPRRRGECAVDTIAAVVRRLGSQGQQADPQRLGRPTRSSRPPSSTTPGWSWSPRAVAASATRVLVGSTAQRVQHYAPCPVLVVRPAPRVEGAQELSPIAGR